MKFKSFRQFLEEREQLEGNVNPNQQIDSKPTDQTLRKIGAAVERLPDKDPITAFSGQDPTLTKNLIAQGAKDGVTPAQFLAAIRPAAAKAVQPQPGQVLNMRKR